MGLVALPLLPKTERMVRPEPDARSLGVKQQCGPASIPAWLSDAFTRTQQRAVRPDRAESASGRRAAPRRDAARAGGDPVQSHLRESERPPQSGSGPIRTSASSPKHSPAAGRPEHETNRPTPRSLTRARGRLRKSDRGHGELQPAIAFSAGACNRTGSQLPILPFPLSAQWRCDRRGSGTRVDRKEGRGVESRRPTVNRPVRSSMAGLHQERQRRAPERRACSSTAPAPPAPRAHSTNWFSPSSHTR